MIDNLYLMSAEREFQSLLLQLGHDEWSADLKAFQLTQRLAARVRELRALWDCREKPEQTK